MRTELKKNNRCYFASDLHGHEDKYEKLFQFIFSSPPDLLLLGGDILPSGIFHFSAHTKKSHEFIHSFLIKNLSALRDKLKEDFPIIFLIPGNDDPKVEEIELLEGEQLELWTNLNSKKMKLGEYSFYGYPYVSPTPFRLKDWEKYDVSRYVDPGCISPEEGIRTVQVNENTIRLTTIKNDIEKLVGNDSMENAICLFHSPPYKTNLDRAALDGKMIDHVPLDVHVGSIAIKKFIEQEQPLLTLHGHIHESTSLTGKWQDKIGRTFCFNAAHHGRELSVIQFKLDDIPNAKRFLI
ncbi:MAG: metallophosphoesterase [bacterium]